MDVVVDGRGGRIPECESFRTVRVDPEAGVLRNLASWRLSGASDAFPFDEVLESCRRCGKHFVSSRLKDELAQTRAAVSRTGSGAHPFLRPFLDVLLDKHDGCYDYCSYLALKLLGLPSEETLLRYPRDPQKEVDHKIVLLVTDILCFELDALAGKAHWMPLRAASRKVVETRCHRALKALLPYLDRLGLAATVSLEDPVSTARRLVQHVDARKTAEESLRLQVSHIPVFVVHDEYMFIRILQCFETVFAWLCALLRVAIEACAKDVRQSIASLRKCCDLLQDAAPFFHLLATLDPGSFKAFRIYTEGASAIQSRSYKRVESLCSRPDEERLRSIAYHSVPEIQQLVLTGHETLDEAYLAARDRRSCSDELLKELGSHMAQFAAALQRWRRSHYGIAVRLLGTGTGTGYTEGTPYLKGVRDIPVFRAIVS